MRTQHFVSDSLCQLKLIELQLLLEALFNTRSTRESTRDPGAKKTSLMKFCKGCKHQHVFGCEVGVLPAVPPEDVKVGFLMPRMHTLHVFAFFAPCACTCVQGSPQAPPFPRPPATHFMSVCHKCTFQVVGQPSCKRFVLNSLRPLLLLQKTRWLDGQDSQTLTFALH